MRTRPGSRFWAWTYTVLYFLQNGWPGWAGATAGAVFFLWGGPRAPRPRDARAVHLIGVGAYLACVLILLLGGRRIERTLEILNWTLVLGDPGHPRRAVRRLRGAVAGFAAAAAGFVGLRHRHGGVPADARRRRLVPDRRVRGLFGRGGVINITLSNWARDKGYGMGQVVGYIPARWAGSASAWPIRAASSSPTRERSRAGAAGGASCARTSGASSSRARCWAWRCPRSSTPRSSRRHRAARAGHRVRAGPRAGRARRARPWRCVLALVSVWILFKTQLDILEAMVRSLTDMLWSASPRAARLPRRRRARVYFGVLARRGRVGRGRDRPQPADRAAAAGRERGGLRAVAGLAPHPARQHDPAAAGAAAVPRAPGRMLVAMAVFYGFFVWLWLMGGLVPDPQRGFLFGLARRLHADVTSRGAAN